MLQHFFPKFLNNCQAVVQAVSYRNLSIEVLQSYDSQSMRDFECSMGQCERFFSEHSSTVLPVSFHQCSIIVFKVYVAHNNIIIIIIIIFTAIGLSPGGSGYFTCIQNMKLVTTKFKSGGLHEKHVVATWNVGNRLSICL